MFDLMPFDRRHRNMARSFDSIARDFFEGFDSGLTAFNTDIRDRGDHYELTADLPGFRKEDIHIDVDGDMLVIHAEHDESKEDKKDDYIRRERRYGSFSRSFHVANVKTDQIDAAYQDGVLKLVLPKSGPATPPTRRIDIR